MANDLSDIVVVNITAQTNIIDTASFNIPMVMASFTNFSERTRVYTTTDEVADDFPSTSNVYKMVSQLFSQDLKVPQVVVGRRQVDEVDGSIATVANTTVYTVTINGTDYTYTSDANATAIEIVAGLDTAVGALSGINFTDNLDGTFSVAVATPGTDWSITASSNISLVNVTPTETWTDAIAAIEDENNDWYALTCESHVKADILEVAAAIQAREKIYGTSSSDADLLTTAITDVGTALSDLNYDRTFIVYSATANTEFPECAWIGSQLPEVPGSNDWDLKSVSGVTVSSLSSTQKTNLRAKEVNFYTRKSGVEIFQDGDMSSGTPIDETIFIDWLTARLQESVFFRLVNSKKIPMTRAGATIIENEIRSVMSEGVRNGGIADAPAYTVISPDPLAIPPAQRAQRIMGDFVISFRLAGSVRKVVITGTATL